MKTTKKQKLKNKMQVLKEKLAEYVKDNIELLDEQNIMQQRINSQVEWIANKDKMYLELLSTKDALIEALRNKLANFESSTKN